MLRPVIAMRERSTSLRRSGRSITGRTTVSQRVVNETSSTNSNCPWPGHTEGPGRENAPAPHRMRRSGA